MREVALSELLAMFDESVHVAIRAAVERCEATHVVCFENHMFNSSCFGDRTAIVVGPTCTYKAPFDCEGKWLNDLPSQRQYPVCYASVEG